jgi:hypothetical protein
MVNTFSKEEIAERRQLWDRIIFHSIDLFNNTSASTPVNELKEIVRRFEHNKEFSNKLKELENE